VCGTGSGYPDRLIMEFGSAGWQELDVWTPSLRSTMVSDRAFGWTGRSLRADVAQLVEHHLAKVRVAGSNPVVRSERVSPTPAGSTAPTVEWPRGEATDCKSVYTGSNPVSTSGD
jgi:hypothetical protein